MEEASSLGSSGTGRHVAPACLRWKKHPLLVVVGQVASTVGQDVSWSSRPSSAWSVPEAFQFRFCFAVWTEFGAGVRGWE